jgi:hypothetical protein
MSGGSQLCTESGAIVDPKERLISTHCRPTAWTLTRRHSFGSASSVLPTHTLACRACRRLTTSPAIANTAQSKHTLRDHHAHDSASASPDRLPKLLP